MTRATLRSITKFLRHLPAGRRHRESQLSICRYLRAVLIRYYDYLHSRAHLIVGYVVGILLVMAVPESDGPRGSDDSYSIPNGRNQGLAS